jgi:hypothetical protein
MKPAPAASRISRTGRTFSADPKLLGASSGHGDRAQRPVVHIDDPAPGDPTRVDREPVAPIDVVVDQRCEQVVRRGDGVEVAGEVQVDALHRHHLGLAAAGGAALGAEHRAERGLAQHDHGALADPGERVAEADRRRLAFARRRRIDRGDEDEFAVGAVRSERV